MKKDVLTIVFPPKPLAGEPLPSGFSAGPFEALYVDVTLAGTYLEGAAVGDVLACNALDDTPAMAQPPTVRVGSSFMGVRIEAPDVARFTFRLPKWDTTYRFLVQSFADEAPPAPAP